jgi:hypothetical protein
MGKVTKLNSTERDFKEQGKEVLPLAELNVQMGIESVQSGREHFERAGYNTAESMGIPKGHAKLIIDGLLKEFDQWCEARASGATDSVGAGNPLDAVVGL